MEIIVGIVIILLSIAAAAGISYYLTMKIVDCLGDSIDATLDKAADQEYRARYVPYVQYRAELARSVPVFWKEKDDG